MYLKLEREKGIDVINKKMLFIRNREQFNTEKVIQSFEFEVLTDAHIVGSFEYKPFYLNIWDFGFFNEGEERKLCLRIESNVIENYELPETSRNAYYSGGDVADEIISLVSLFLRRKLKLGQVVRINDKPMRISKRNNWIDKPLVSGESNLVALIEWFDLVQKLSDDLHQKYILAVRLYHRAILIIEDEPDLAYLNLISSIEVLCQDTDIGEVSLSDIDPKLFEIIKTLEDSIRIQLEERILKRERFIKRKFVKFIIDNIEEDFWNEEQPVYGRIEKDALSDYLGRIYKQRSMTLHTGAPFPPNIYNNTIDNCDIDFSLGMSIGEKQWKSTDYIPNPHYFERLVNHVLKVYLKKNINNI